MAYLLAYPQEELLTEESETKPFQPLHYVCKWLIINKKKLAERGGFEPPVQCYPYNGLANRHFRPLSHLSALAFAFKLDGLDLSSQPTAL